ncbi:cell division protein FtsL [Thiomicrorhabdus indica]|uniref:cell division protein FtsL n=1 Tax=Thiomicrorhabdus indica TaxID=2267253 RepID=UPI002AA8DBEC|nr:cell division protein FtsL [Thiomicrorhabdus indica]
MSQQASKKLFKHLSSFQLGLLFALLGILFFLAISVVNMKEKVRVVQTQLFQINTEIQQQREKWGELMLQKTHLESPAKVEVLAKQKLRMQSAPKAFLTIKILPDSNTLKPMLSADSEERQD